MDNKTLEGKIPYEIQIVDGNLNMRLQQSNENNLIALEMTRNWFQLQLDRKYAIKGYKKETKILKDTITLLTEHISALGKFVIDKYKDAVPEEKKVKLLNYDPVKHKLPKLKG